MKRRMQRGYAILVICFLAAATLIMTAAAVPNLLTESRREKEEELIWRGEQYARAVRLFYRKNGRFPQSFEDLTEPKNNVRFLRKAFPDPMNREDGSWRMIYVGPAGELIGSVRRGALQGFSFGQPGKTPAAPEKQPATGTAGATPAAPGTPPPAEAKAPGSTERVFGGNIIGVASKVNRASIKVYKDGANYREWEFIWDPRADLQPGQAVPGSPGPPVLPRGPGIGRPPGGPPPPPPRPLIRPQ
jgi:type II secretory pathway pseudopilin PulG